MGLEGRTISRVREKSSLSALPTPWSLIWLWKRILCYEDRPENFVPSGLEITHSQWYKAVLCTVKNGSSHLTYMEQSEPLDRRGTSSNWLRSESVKGTDPHIFLSQASVRITAINKCQHNTKFCIFITCPLPTQTSTLHYSLRRPVLSCEPALLHVRSRVDSISHVVTRATSLSPAVTVTHLKPCWAKWLIRCIPLQSVKTTCLPSSASTWRDSLLQQQSIFLCRQAHL